jgi:hypothetical protein
MQQRLKSALRKALWQYYVMSLLEHRLVCDSPTFNAHQDTGCPVRYRPLSHIEKGWLLSAVSLNHNLLFLTQCLLRQRFVGVSSGEIFKCAPADGSRRARVGPSHWKEQKGLLASKAEQTPTTRDSGIRGVGRNSEYGTETISRNRELRDTQWTLYAARGRSGDYGGIDDWVI